MIARKFFLSFVALSAGLVATPLMAAADLSGFWSPPSNQHPVDQGMVQKLPKGTVLIDDSGYVEFPPLEFGGLTLTPEAMAKARSWKAEDTMTVQNVCAIPSIIYAIQGPFPIEIHQFSDVVVMRLEYFDQTRIIFMDGRPHPNADYPRTYVGFSTGIWDGDELLVTTSHIKASTITNNGLDHGDDVQFVERFRLSEDGKTLLSTQWFFDETAIKEPGARFMKWDKQANGAIMPYGCDPSFALDFEQVKPNQTLDDSEFSVIDE